MKKEQFIALLLLAGVPSARIEELKANMEKEDYQPDMDAFKTDIRTHQLSMYKNDPDLVGEIRSSEAAKQLDIVDRWLKQEFGLSSEDIKDKKTRELIAVAKSKAMENSNKTNEELSNENMQLKSELKKIREEEIPNIQSQIENDRKALKIEQALEKLAKDGFEYRNPFDAVFNSNKIAITQKYKFELNESGELELIDTKTGLKAKTADGTNFLTPKDLWKETSKNNGFLKESNADEGAGAGAGTGAGAGAKPKVDNKADVYSKYPHLAKAEEHLSEIKADKKP